MSGNILVFASLFALCSSLGLAANKPKTPFYKKPAPKHVCDVATDLDKRTSSCTDNPLFLQSALRCWGSVTKTADQVAKELKAQDASAVSSQGASFLSSQAHLAEAIAGQTYELEVTEQALEDLDKYFDYVVRPDDIESDDEILHTPCYRDAVVPMDQLSERMENKIASLKKSLSDMEEKFAESSDRAHQIGGSAGSAAATAVSGNPGSSGPAVAPNKNPPKQQSTITGVEEDKKKQQQK